MPNTPSPNAPVSLLVNIIAPAVELPHRIPVDHVDVAIFSRAHGELPDRARAIIEVRQHQRSAGTEIGIGVILRVLIAHLEVVGDCQCT